MKILRAAEDYLEAMLMMQKRHGYIRSIDIAEFLGVTKPSVTYTTKRLKENGYITMDKDGLITLTASGMAIAERMLDRHHTLTKFLMALGIDAATAETDACKIEHDISQKTFDRRPSASPASLTPRSKHRATSVLSFIRLTSSLFRRVLHSSR